HCLLAAGVSGLIKVVLALQHRQLPPTIHFEKLNDHIDLKGSPFYVNDCLQEWGAEGGSRRQAALNSFGYSGTNAHLVIAEYAPQAQSSSARPAIKGDVPTIVPLSARTTEQLQQKARDLLSFIREQGAALSLADLAYTLQIGREPMEERLGFLSGSME